MPDDKLPGRSSPFGIANRVCLGKAALNLKVFFEIVCYYDNTLRYDWNIMNELHSEHTIVERPQYMKVIEETFESPAIKVLTGIRRCGKSTLLRRVKDELIKSGVPANNLLYKRMDSFGIPLEPDAAWLDALLSTALQEASSSHHLYVFLDEIQEVKGWERPLRRLYESGRARIYLTGSNAFLLSSDLATYLSGRYIEIPVFPLSFKEYCAFSGTFNKPEDESLFDSYLRFGGMPGLFESTNFTEASVARELAAIRDTVLLNDVAKRFSIRDIDLLEKLVRYVYTTSGNLFSANKVAGALTSAGRKTNAETVDNYLNALKRAFALHECQQVGLKGKTVLQPQRKYYAPDTGLRNLETGFSMQDIGFQLENIVYMELIRRGYETYVGTLAAGEVDFVAQRHSERLYIQVCETLLDAATRAREVAPLERIGDAYPKLILTRDQTALGTTESGIRIELVSQWLLEKR